VNPLSIVVQQTAPGRCEVDANLAEMRARLEGSPPGSLVVFPELSLTGYDIGARARELALRTDAPPPLVPEDGTRLLIGFPEAADGGRLFNTAGLIGPGEQGWLHRHRKIYLPTYGSFDEGRIFSAATEGPDLVELMPGWPGAVLVCEDLWHPSLPWLAALRGAEVLVVMAAAPGRPVLGGEGMAEPADRDSAGDGMVTRDRFGSVEAWRTLARGTAFTHGLWVVLANRSGVEGGITFAGHSMVVDPTGRVVAQAGPEEETLTVELDPGTVARARRDWSHLRDDDPEHLRRELDRPGGRWRGRPGNPAPEPTR